MPRTGFFEEAPGEKSSMRLMSFVSLLSSILFAYLTIKTGNRDGITLTVAFLVGAFAPKAVQRFAENGPPVIAKEQEDA